MTDARGAARGAAEALWGHGGDGAGEPKGSAPAEPRRRRSLATTARASRRGLAAALGAALGLMTLPAAAHAPPLGARVLTPASPASGSEEVIVTNRGLVFRDPASGSSRLLCNEALRINTSELPNVALLGDGGLLVATSSGLRLSRDRGCTWADVGQMETTNTPALAADPSDPNRVYVANYDSDIPGLRETLDAGVSWSLMYETAEADYVHSILVSAPDPRRIYATLTAYDSGPPTHSLLRTLDRGATWERLLLPLNEKDYRAIAAAVGPDDPDTLILYTVANSPGVDTSRLLVSRDGGDSFEVALERPEIRGAGYGQDGRLWVAARDGLYGSNGELAAFARTSVASELGCVSGRAGTLLVCGHYAGLGTAESGIGVSNDGGQSFERWLDFSRVAEPVECSPDSLTTSLCARPWLDWETEMLGAVPGNPGAYGPVGPAPPELSGATPSPSAPPEVEVSATSEGDDTEGASCALQTHRSPAPTKAAGFGLLLVAGCWAMRRSGRRSPA
jgi:hypothetical protein